MRKHISTLLGGLAILALLFILLTLYSMYTAEVASCVEGSRKCVYYATSAIQYICKGGTWTIERTCPLGCAGDVCYGFVAPTTTTTIRTTTTIGNIYQCFDSDGGKNVYEKGRTQGLASVAQQSVVKYDECTTDPWWWFASILSGQDYIKEYYCENNYVKGVAIECPLNFKCIDGVCVLSGTTTTTTLITTTIKRTTTTSIPITTTSLIPTITTTARYTTTYYTPTSTIIPTTTTIPPSKCSKDDISIGDYCVPTWQAAVASLILSFLGIIFLSILLALTKKQK